MRSFAAAQDDNRGPALPPGSRQGQGLGSFAAAQDDSRRPALSHLSLRAVGWEWAQEGGRLEIEESWRRRGACCPVGKGRREHIKVGTKCRRLLVHRIGIGRIFPLARIQAMNQGL